MVKVQHKDQIILTTFIAEAQYSINFLISNRRFFLSLQYIRSNSFLFVNVTKIYQFKAKDSEIKKYLFRLCFGYFSTNNIKNGRLYNFPVDYRAFDANV